MSLAYALQRSAQKDNITIMSTITSIAGEAADMAVGLKRGCEAKKARKRNRVRCSVGPVPMLLKASGRKERELSGKRFGFD